MMKKKTLIKITVTASLCLLTVFAYAVTRDELINKCMEAGAVVKNQGLKSAIKMIEDPHGPFVWHNNINYVFLMNLEGEMLAHPFNPELKSSGSLLKLADQKGSLFIDAFVKAATSQPGMGWVRYMWPLPGTTEPIQKYTFIYRIPETDYFVGSGFYVIKPGEYY